MNKKISFSLKNRKRDYKEWLWIGVILAAFFVYAGFIMLQSPNNPSSKVVEYTDSSVFQYIGKGILEGMIPYRDAFDHKGPVLYLINALGFLLADRYGVWLLEWVILFFTLVVSYKLCRVYFTRIASVFAVFSTFSLLGLYLKGGNFTEEYAMLPIVGALYIFANYFKYKKVTNLQLFLLGAGCMSVLLLKANVAAVWVVYCFYFFVTAIYEKQWKELWRYIIYFLAGSAVVFVPIALWLAMNGAWDDFVMAYIEFNMAYTEAKGAAGRFNIFLEMIRAAKFFLTDQMQLHLMLGVLAPVMIFLKERDKGKAMFVLLNSVYLFATFYFMIMPGRQYVHYGLYYIPAMVVVFGVLFHYLEKWLRKDNEVLVCISACLLIFCVKTFFISNMFVQIDEIALTREESAYNEEILDIVEELTEPEDEIIFMGSKCWIYNHSDRKAPNRYIFQRPLVMISEEINEEFHELFEENPPDLIITQDYDVSMDEEAMREPHGYVLKKTYEDMYFYTLE